MNLNYWKQKATPWVSAAVLAGGLATACILFFLVRVENKVDALQVPADIESYNWKN